MQVLCLSPCSYIVMNWYDLYFQAQPLTLWASPGVLHLHSKQRMRIRKLSLWTALFQCENAMQYTHSATSLGMPVQLLFDANI